MSAKLTIVQAQAKVPHLLVLKYVDRTTVTVKAPRCGHAWEAKMSHLVYCAGRESQGCFKCGGTIKLTILQAQAKVPHLLVLKYVHRTNVTVKRRCGHTWKAQMVSLERSANRESQGCAICANHGFDNTKPAWLYFMERPGEMQIGITNHIGDRLKYHARNGWELIEADGPHSGVSIEIREKAIKAYLREAGLLIPGKHEDWLTSDWEPYSLQAIEYRVTTNQGEMT